MTTALKHVPIGELVNPITDWRPAQNPDQVVTYIDLGAVDQGTKVVTGAREIRAREAPSRARQLVAQGDVLVATVRPNLNGVAVVPPELDGAVASTGFCVLRARPRLLDTRYLFHWTKTPTFVHSMVRRATGASYPAVSDRIILESRIPLRPIAEQRRIAQILDRAEALRDKRDESATKLRSLQESIFLDLFGDPLAGDTSWPVLPFGEVCELRLGKMLDQKRQTGQHQRPYLRNANVQWFRVDVTDVNEMDFDEVDRERLRLQPGDLLICEGGEPGRAAIWRGELEECYYQKAIHRARPLRRSATPEYLGWLLWFLAHGGGLRDYVTSSTIAHLTSEKLKAVPTPLPPLKLQAAFSSHINAAEQLLTKQRASLEQFGSVLSSLQNAAFEGRI